MSAPPVRAGTNHLLVISLRTLTAKRVNGPGAGENFATMPESARDNVFFSGFNGDPSLTKYQGVATLDDHQVIHAKRSHAMVA